MEDERMLPEYDDEHVDDVMAQQINTSLKDDFRDHRDEIGLSFFAAAAVFCFIRACFFGKRALG